MTVDIWYGLAAGSGVLMALAWFALSRRAPRKALAAPRPHGRIVFPGGGRIGRYAFDGELPMPEPLVADDREPAVIAIIHFVRPSESGPDWRHLYLTQFEAESLTRRIREVPKHRPIHLVLHTPGGSTFGAQMIAQALNAHDGPVTAFVPYYAMSAGTLIALTADTIHMAPGAALGPIDTQFDHIPVDAYLQLLKKKGPKNIDDEMLLLCFTAQKIAADDEKSLGALINPAHGRGDPGAIARYLASGVHFHGYRVSFEKARALGMNVVQGVPDEVSALVDSEQAANDADLRRDEERRRRGGFDPDRTIPPDKPLS